MDYRFDYAVHDVNAITYRLLDKVCTAAMGDNNTSINPLFPNGDSWMLYSKWHSQEEFDAYAEQHEDVKPYRIRDCSISFRNYCGTLELLVVNEDGNFPLYNKIDGLSRGELIDEYYREIMLVKHLVNRGTCHTFQADMDRMYKDNYEKFFGVKNM